MRTARRNASTTSSRPDSSKSSRRWGSDARSANVSTVTCSRSGFLLGGVAVEGTYAELRLSHSANILRWLHGDPVGPTELAALSGITKQAVSQQVAQLVALGYVEVVDDPADGRRQLLRLSAKGRDAQRVVHSTFATIESEWRGQLGDDVWQHFVAGLTHIAAIDAHPRIMPLD